MRTPEEVQKQRIEMVNAFVDDLNKCFHHFINPFAVEVTNECIRLLVEKMQTRLRPDEILMVYERFKDCHPEWKDWFAKAEEELHDVQRDGN